MRFKILWNTDYEYSGHRGSPDDPRPTIIEADNFELLYPIEGGNYPVGLLFVKDETTVATIFQLPIAVLSVADIQE